MLYVVGTPIGNLDDASFRMIDTLKNVDLIAAEDTRKTAVLCSHFGIETPLTSYYEHNKKVKGIKLINDMLEGKNIALVTDAGMPGISDPGEDLIKLCIENNIECTVIPGPSAFVAAAVMSGLPTRYLYFEGFLPTKKSDKSKRLNELATKKETIILYEAPHKLTKTLSDLFESFGNRNIALGREITKKYEEFKRGKISDIIEYYNENSPKGEYVIVIDGLKDETENYDIDICEHIELFINSGMSKKDAITMVSKLRNIPKRVVYNTYEHSFEEKNKY